MIAPFLLVSVLLSAGLSAAALFQAGKPFAVGVALLIGLLWLLGTARRWRWAAIPCFFMLMGLTVIGLLAGASPLLLSLAALSALAGWDLSNFLKRLRLADADDDTRPLERAHLGRLLLVLLAGGIVLIPAQRLQIGFSFEWLALLLLVSAWGVGLMLRRLLGSDEK